MPAPFEPLQIIATLNRHGVRYVIIGGFAAVGHGSTLPTTDVDVTPDPSPDNLASLSAALDDLQARIRVGDSEPGLPFAHDARSLGQLTVLNLTTAHGNLDLVMTPAGGLTYLDMAPRSLTVELHGVAMLLADLDDIIVSKRAAGRPKDLQTLPVLEELRRRLGEPRDR